MHVGSSSPEVLGTPGRYHHPTLIAAGGSGRVYRVRDTVRELDLALKLVSPGEAAWLRREFDTLRHIRHENVIQVYDWGSMESGGAFYTMELVEGGDWGKNRRFPQPPGEVRRILTSVLRGLSHLHSHGETHGDLKPGNILLGTGAVVKVSDVGMGASDDVASASATPGFAAPEMWEGGKASVQGDIYSVGVMAYEALTGHHPFEGRTVREVVSGQLEGWVPSPRVYGVTLPADLDKSVMRALERNPTLRQASADEFLEEIGDQDRVGDILGGRFVGRSRELSRLHGYLSADVPDTPTAVLICGPPGVGKTTLIDELAHQCLVAKERVLHVSGGDLTQGLASALKPVDEEPAPNAAEVPLSSIAEGLWRLGSEGPVLVRFEPPSSDEARAAESLIHVSRFLAALAIERGRSSHVLVVLEFHGPSETPDKTHEVMALEALDVEETALLARGFLGNLRLEAGQGERLHLATGGLPNAILDLLTDLITRGVLVRRAGKWSLRDLGELRELRHSGVPARIGIAWNQLDAQQKRVLTATALFEQGIGAASLGAVAPHDSGAQQALASKGWTAIKNNRVLAASQGIRDAVLDLASAADRAEIERLVLTDASADIDREDRALGLLRHPDLPGALTLGIAAAEASFATRDYRRAVESGRACLRIAVDRGDNDSAKRALFVVADALHRLGRYDEARLLLTDECPVRISTDDTVRGARRERLLGTIHREQGDLAKARDHLTRSIELAGVTGDLSLSLRSQADLADMDWRYGDETLRAGAMARVKDVIASVPDTHELRNERAALTYQLGAALILSGRREEATAVLQSALAFNPGDYWRMRIANATSTAEYYLGHFHASLKWIDEARRYADSSGSDSYKARIYSNRAGVCYGLGRFREAVEQHDLSAMWARRTGSRFEYQAACSGASINLTITGRYEEAIAKAQESQQAARQTGDLQEIAKSYELEGLACFHLGELGEAERLVSLGLAQARESDAREAAPRLDWLAARISMAKCEWAAAEDHLKRALTILEVSKDWEDLPGVQIELQFLGFRKEDPSFDLVRLVNSTAEAEERGAVLVFLRGALAVGEVLVQLGRDDAEHRRVLLRALGGAETSGATELAWQLSYLIGELDLRGGDLKSASSRHGHAFRGLRDIAGRLSSGHRASYLETPHARSLLSRVGNTK